MRIAKTIEALNRLQALIALFSVSLRLCLKLLIKYILLGLFNYIGLSDLNELRNGSNLAQLIALSLKIRLLFDHAFYSIDLGFNY